MNDFEDYEIIDSDAWEIKRDMINKFQELSGRKLTEASPKTLIFETVAYMIGLREEIISIVFLPLSAAAILYLQFTQTIIYPALPKSAVGDGDLLR